MFSTISETNFKFLVTFILSSRSSFNLDQSKNVAVWKRVKASLDLSSSDTLTSDQSTITLFGKALSIFM